MSRVIIVSKFLEAESAATRESARELFNIVNQTQATEITLDFSSINFASKAFVDELTHLKNEASAKRKIEILNLSVSLSHLFDLVESSNGSAAKCAANHISNST